MRNHIATMAKIAMTAADGSDVQYNLDLANAYAWNAKKTVDKMYNAALNFNPGENNRRFKKTVDAAFKDVDKMARYLGATHRAADKMGRGDVDKEWLNDLYSAAVKAKGLVDGDESSFGQMYELCELAGTEGGFIEDGSELASETAMGISGDIDWIAAEVKELLATGDSYVKGFDY